jgi:group II intron reverse transcriptase/maturase
MFPYAIRGWGHRDKNNPGQEGAAFRASWSEKGNAQRYQGGEQNEPSEGKNVRNSENPIVAEKRGNQPERDPVERRGGRETEPMGGKMAGTPSLGTISTKQQRIAKLAGEAPDMAFTSLSHHIDLDWLYLAYRRTRKDGAVGIDGQTAKDYEANLMVNLRSLLDRAKSGTYQAPPVRRVFIPKGDGTNRPLGIPAFEDKVLQRAVVMVLEPLYERDFHDCSYGFRPGRSAHQALEAGWKKLMEMGGGWVLEMDIKKYFDTINHGKLREALSRRVRDGVIVRLIGKWLNAGVMEKGNLSYPEAGTPQGGVVSPLLANIYLHEVLDEWFEKEVKPRLKGKAFLIRYADDAVLGFERGEDARRVNFVLPKRFEKYGLTIHPEKTRLLDFRKPEGKDEDKGGKPGSFDFLGFTHYWAKSRKGNWVVKQKTALNRFRRAVSKIKEWCQANRHKLMAEQQRELTQKLKGHYGYYGITGNSPWISKFSFEVTRLWRKWLSRRSQKSKIGWEQFNKLLKQFALPPPITVHSIYRHVANP